MLNPWVFGDEYLYISKARNLKWGIDVISDATLGHTYPPLYSYLLSLGITEEAASTYARIQFLNVAISQILILASFYLLNQVFHFTKTKKGWFFLVLAYLITSTLPAISGYHLVAMSENLYTPLLLLISSFFIYLQAKGSKKIWQWGLFALLAGLAILTRSIGLALLPASAMALIWLRGQTWKKWLVPLLISLIGTALVWQVWERVEDSLVQQATQATAQIAYNPNSYLRVFSEALAGRHNFLATFKVTGNHLIYLFLASFAWPFLFYLAEIGEAWRRKSWRKFSPEFIWLTSLGIFAFGLSYLHSYLGFLANPIKYSTYFRYMDPAIALFWLYGLLRLWQYLEGKFTLRKLELWMFSVLTLLLVLMLPARDFYTTINSLGWSYLDLLKGQALLIKAFLLFLAGISLILLKLNRQKAWLLAGPLLLINILTWRLNYLDLHRWQASIYRDKVDPLVEELLVENGVQQFYLQAKMAKTESDHSHLYYLKYRLLFENREFLPLPLIDFEAEQEKLLKSDTTFALVDSPQAVYDEASASYPLGDKWQVFVFKL